MKHTYDLKVQKRFIRFYRHRFSVIDMAHRLRMPRAQVQYWVSMYNRPQSMVRTKSNMNASEIRKEIRAIALTAHKWPSLMNGAKARIEQLEKQLNGKFI